jgi:ABC-type transport system involved in multi-copper enzyme maturation permease subunit
MLLTIAVREFRERLLRLRFVVTLVAMMILVSATVVALAYEHRREADDYNRRVELHRKEVEKGDFNVMRVDRPAPSLSSLFKGLGANAPDQIELSDPAPPEPRQTIETEATEAMFPAIDLSFCVCVVLSLVALLFSYDAITGEKESGTLKQVLSNSVSRATLIGAKWIALTATMGVLVIAALVWGALLARLLPGSPFVIRASDAIALLMIAAVGVLLVSAFTILGILVSSLVPSSSSSLAILMLAWVTLVFVFPNASPYLAVWISPAQTYQQASRSEKQINSDMYRELKERNAKGAEKVKAEKLNGSQMDKIISEIRDAWNEERKQSLSRLREDYAARLRQQEKRSALIAALSPYGSAAQAMAALSDSGVESDDRFLRLARIFDDDQLSAYSRLSAELPKDRRPSPPLFTYEATPVGERLSSIAFQLSVLIAYNAILFIASLWAFRRYDVR